MGWRGVLFPRALRRRVTKRQGLPVMPYLCPLLPVFALALRQTMLLLHCKQLFVLVS
jgi:hypothetical protein